MRSPPYSTMTGNPYFGLRFYGTKNLVLGAITLNLSSGMGIRFDRDQAANSNVKMGTIRVTGASSHAVEIFNIDGLNIDAVYATNVGESGLLIQTSTNVWVGLVNGNNVGAGTGYGTLRFANRNGRLASGSYATNGKRTCFIPSLSLSFPLSCTLSLSFPPSLYSLFFFGILN